MKNLSSLLIFVLGIILALGFAFLIAKTGLFSLLIIAVLLATLILTYFILRDPELGWILIIFFLPFERVPTVHLAGIDLKINVFLGFITLTCWILALAFNGKKFKIQPNFLAIPLLTFFMVMVLSLYHAVNLQRGLTVLIFVTFTMMLSVLAVSMVKDKEKLSKTLTVLFFSSLVIGLFGLFQFGGNVVGLPNSITLLKEGYDSSVFGFPRVQAFSMEPLYLANYLLIPICVGLVLFFNRVDFLRRYLLPLVALLLVIFILTVSRGGYLGLVVSLVVIGCFFLRKIFTFRNVIIVAVVAFVVSFGVYFALGQGENRALTEFIGHVTLSDVSKGGESIYGRLSDYQTGLNVWRENPILGTGIGNFGPRIATFPNQMPPTGWKIVNNQYIELLAETGIVGLGAFLLIIVFLIYRTFLSFKYAQDIFLKSVLIGLFAALIGVLVQYNFVSTLYIIHIWILIGLLVAVQNIILSQNSKLKTQNSKLKT